jgi:hypothetical protein
MTPGWTPPDAEVVSLKEAAVRLGISPDAIRKRLERGTLHGEKRAGRWRVFLEPDAEVDASGDLDQDATPDARRTPLDASQDSALVAHLEQEITYLRQQLDHQTRITAGLVEQLRALPPGEPLQGFDPGTLRAEAPAPTPDAPRSLIARLRAWIKA